MQKPMPTANKTLLIKSLPSVILNLNDFFTIILNLKLAPGRL